MAAAGAAGLRKLGLPRRRLWSEYEEWPRGRVVFHQATRRFIVCADRKLWPQPVLDLMLVRFSLPEHEFDLRGDPHYVSVRAVR